MHGRLPTWLVLVTFSKLRTWELSASMVLGLQGAFSFFFLFLFLYSVPFWRNYQYSWNNNALDGLYRLHLNAILLYPGSFYVYCSQDLGVAWGPGPLHSSPLGLSSLSLPWLFLAFLGSARTQTVGNHGYKH